MTAVYVACFLLLGTAAVLAVYRLERGPSMFDRIVSVDVMTAIIIGTVTITAAVTGRRDLVPVLVVLTLVGFVGSVAIARFAAAESADEARILTREELAEILAEREARASDDAPPVHDVDTNVVIAVLDISPQGDGRTVREPAGATAVLSADDDELGADEGPDVPERGQPDPAAPAGPPETGGAR